MDFNTQNSSKSHLMLAGSLSCGLNMPAALHSEKQHGEETAHALPPHRPRKAFLVDRYPACPANWMRSSGRTASYFVAVKEGAGMWLDFNDANTRSANDLAVVVSAQGINSVTGLPCRDVQLEQYRDKCPKHDLAFGPNRFCKQCNFKWPKQNYLASAGTPRGMLWLDGFRTEDGVIRQYVLTADRMRGVANAIVGEQRVFALGISFFLAKTPRPVTAPSLGRMSVGHMITSSWDDGEIAVGCDNYGAKSLESFTSTSGIACASSGVNEISYGGKLTSKSAGSQERSIARSRGSIAAFVANADHGLMASKSRGKPVLTASYAANVDVKKLEIAAGAKVNQIVHDDPCDLDHYQKEPEAILVVNYCSEAEAEAIIQAGEVDVEGDKDGFMQTMPVGN